MIILFPDSWHTNKVSVILRRYAVLEFVSDNGLILKMETLGDGYRLTFTVAGWLAGRQCVGTTMTKGSPAYVDNLSCKHVTRNISNVYF